MTECWKLILHFKNREDAMAYFNAQQIALDEKWAWLIEVIACSHTFDEK